MLRHFKGVLGVDVPARLSFSYSFVFVLFKQIHIEVLKAAIGCLVLGGRGGREVRVRAQALGGEAGGSLGGPDWAGGWWSHFAFYI